MSNDPRKPGHNARTQEKARQLQQAQLEALIDLRATFSTAAGKRTLERLRAAAGTDDPAGPSALPPGWTAGEYAIFRQGQRSVILEIYQKLAQPEDTPERPAAVS